MTNGRGEVTERLKVLASKASVRETVPWVRIPPSPPYLQKLLISLPLNPWCLYPLFVPGPRTADVHTNVLTTAREDRILFPSWRAMRFEWDEQKNRQNLHKHDVRFETAVLVFDDPYAITQRDFTFEDEERWITVGAIGPGSILLVVHTFYEEHDEEVIRVISARAAESHERRAYEEAHKEAETRHPSYRRKKRRGH
jgi:uncharacterized DUF497 family protein